MNPHAKIISAEIDERRLMRYGRLTAFKDEKSAAIAGAWFAGLNGNEKAARFAAENGAPVMKAAGESINSAGGALVPDVLMKTIIALREERGAFRRNAQIVPMASDNATTPRRTGGLTAYFPQSENTTITESQNVWDNVGLTVSKLA